MDDFEFDIQDSYKDSRRKVKLVKNGDPSWITGCLVKDGIGFEGLAETICDAMDVSRRESENVRVFKTGGVEVFNDDVQYIKDGDILYVSFGDEFDESSNFAAFKLRKCLGEGGYGKVYEAKSRLTKDRYAIKMIDCSKIKNAKDTEMIYKELIALKNLTHRNIVKVFNCFTLQKELKVALVLEYLEGGDLRDYINEKKVLGEKEAQKIFSQLFSAVQYCHKENIIHRDLKLENIMFEDKEHDKVKVVDFGISGRQSLVNIDFTEAGSIRYLAPEVITTHAPAHPSIDVWAMGCILFWMMTGNSPFPQSTREAVQDRITKGKWGFSLEDKKNLSKAAQSLIKDILVVNPKQRLSMGEIAEHKWMNMTVDMIFEEEAKEAQQSIILQSRKEKPILTDSPLQTPQEAEGAREGSPYLIYNSNKARVSQGGIGNSSFKPMIQLNGSNNITQAAKSLGTSFYNLASSGFSRKSHPFLNERGQQVQLNQSLNMQGVPVNGKTIATLSSSQNTPDLKPENRLVLPKIDGAPRRSSNTQLASASGIFLHSPRSESGNNRNNNNNSQLSSLAVSSIKRQSNFKLQAGQNSLRSNSPGTIFKVSPSTIVAAAVITTPHHLRKDSGNKLYSSYNDFNSIPGFMQQRNSSNSKLSKNDFKQFN